MDFNPDEEVRKMKKMRADSLFKQTLNFHGSEIQDRSIAGPAAMELAALVRSSTGLTKIKAASALRQVLDLLI